jgi:hypothetical protein
VGFVKAVFLQRFVSVNRAARYLAGFGALVVMAVAVFICCCEYKNSRNVSFPADAQLRSGLSRASAWVFANRERILSEDNAMLWLFVREAGRTSGESRWLELAGDYQSKHADSWVWRYLFDSSGRAAVAWVNIHFPDNMPDYNRLFIYGATCNASARVDPAVAALLSPSACDRGLMWLRSPWCRTHQLMGLRFVQKNHCEPDAAIAETVTQVQNLILSELKWDFRVEDAYIQKVLMLVESGRRKDVKAAWLRKILDAQRADGGWDGVDNIARLPGDWVLCWADGSLYPRITRQRASNFHATAQGLYLLALWLNNDAVTASDIPR